MEIMRNYFLYGVLVLVLAVLPSLHIFPALEVYDEKRLFQVVLLIFVGLFFVGRRLIASLQDDESDNNARPYVMNSVATWGIAFFMLLGIVSIWLNGEWYYGLQELSLYILLFAFMLFTAHIYVYTSDSITASDGIAYNRPFEKGMGLLLLLFGGLYALKFFVGYGMHWFIDYPLWPGARYQNTYFGFANMRFFNQVQVWTLPLFVIWAVSLKKPPGFLKPRRFKIKYCFFFLAAFWWCLIIRSAGRGATLSLLVAAVIVLIIYKQKSHSYIKHYIGAFISGFILKVLLFDLNSGGASAKSLVRGGTGRLETWSSMIQASFSKPILGYGPMSTAEWNGIISLAHPHNSVVQLLYEYGWPTMLIAVGLISWGLYRWFNQMSGRSMERSHGSEQKAINGKPSGRSMLRPNIVKIGVSTSLLAGLGYSLFSGVMVMPLSQLWLVLIGGWALGIYIMNKSNKSKSDVPSFKNVASLTFKGFVLAATLFLSYSLISDVPQLKENQQQYRQEHGGKYHPRFWQQGKIGE